MAISYVNGSDSLVNGSGTALCRAQLGWEKTAETDTTVTYSCKVYIYCIRSGYSTTGRLSASLSATGKDSYNTSGGDCNLDQGERKLLLSHSYSFTKTTSSQSKTITFSVGITSGGVLSGTSRGTKSITVPVLTNYVISYDGNSATSGSMSTQTKYYGKNLTLRSNAYNRTGYNFKNFNTNKSGTGTSYASGGTYKANAKATLYAQWTPQTHTITYYGNGATSGSTYTQTKTYGQTATLYNNFTRDGYSITGWNTAANGSGTAYSTTQVLSATFNSNLTLYAQWKLNYTKATISNLTIQRVENSSSLDEYDQGTVLYVYFEYKTGSASGQWTENPLDELSCTITIDNDEVINNILSLNTTGDNIGGGFLRRWFSNGITGYDTEHSHTVIITLTSGGQTVSKTITISPSTFPIDLLVDNDEVYMGVMHTAETGTPLITSPLKVDGTLTTTNNATINGTLTTTGNTTIGGTLTTTGQYQNFFKITTHTVTLPTGCNAGSYIASAEKTVTQQPGYTLAGIVGSSSTNFRIQPTTRYITSGGNLFIGFANLSNQDVSSSVNVVIYLLWLKATKA